MRRHTCLFDIFLQDWRSDCFAEPPVNRVLPCLGCKAESFPTWWIPFWQLVKVAEVLPLWLLEGSSQDLSCFYLRDFRSLGKPFVIYKGRVCSIIDLSSGRAHRTLTSTFYTYLRPQMTCLALSAKPMRSQATCLHLAQFRVGFLKFSLVIQAPLIHSHFETCSLED